MVLEKEGPNDGLVSIESSKWVHSSLCNRQRWANYTKQGTYLGTLTDVNHLDLVGWINTARYKWASLRGKEIQFKPATFYLGVADLLAREVEGLAPPRRAASDDASGTQGESSENGGHTKSLGRRVAAEGSVKGARRESVGVDDEDPWDARSEGGTSPRL